MFIANMNSPRIVSSGAQSLLAIEKILFEFDLVSNNSKVLVNGYLLWIKVLHLRKVDKKNTCLWQNVNELKNSFKQIYGVLKQKQQKKRKGEEREKDPEKLYQTSVFIVGCVWFTVKAINNNLGTKYVRLCCAWLSVFYAIKTTASS